MRICRLLLPCLIAGSSALSAGPVFYTDLTTFTTAVGSAPSTFGFDSVVSGGGSANFATAAGLSLNGFQFVGTNGTGGYYLGAAGPGFIPADYRSEEHTSELQSLRHLVCRLLLEKKKQHNHNHQTTSYGRRRLNSAHDARQA